VYIESPALVCQCTVVLTCWEWNYGVKILLSSWYLHLLWGPVSMLSSWNWGTKWPERETDNLPLRSAYMTGKIIFIRAYFVTILRCVELIWRLASCPVSCSNQNIWSW